MPRASRTLMSSAFRLIMVLARAMLASPEFHMCLHAVSHTLSMHVAAVLISACCPVKIEAWYGAGMKWDWNGTGLEWNELAQSHAGCKPVCERSCPLLEGRAKQRKEFLSQQMCNAFSPHYLRKPVISQATRGRESSNTGT